MAHSTVQLSSPMTVLGLEPAAAAGGPRRPQQRADEAPFAALLAAIGAPASGDVLPAGGKVLPHGADSSLLGHLASSRSQAVLPAAAATGGVLPDGAALARHANAARSIPGLQTALEGEGLPADESNAFLNAMRAPAFEPSAAGASVPTLGARVDANGAPGASILPAVDGPAAAAEHAPTSEQGRLVLHSEPRSLAPSASLPSDARSAASADAEVQRDLGARFEDVRDSGPAADADAQLDANVAGERRHASDGGARSDASAAAILRPASRGDAAGARGADAAAIAITEAPALSAASGTAGLPPAPVDAAADLQLSTSARAQDAANGLRGAPADLGESVAGRIRVMVDQGTGEARLRLNPPELGAIDVRISVVDDKTYVQITATHSAGREALEQSLPRLRELLAAGGLDVGGTSVDGGGRGAGSGPGTSEPPYAAHAAEDVGDDLAAATAVSAPTRRTASASGRVDLYA